MPGVGPIYDQYVFDSWCDRWSGVGEVDRWLFCACEKRIYFFGGGRGRVSGGLVSVI